MTKRKTNTEIVADFMDFGPTGPMGQMFVIDALRKFSDKIVAEEREVLEEMKDGFVTGESWVATAKALKAHLDAAYDPPKQDDSNLETFSQGHVAIDAEGVEQR